MNSLENSLLSIKLNFAGDNMDVNARIVFDKPMNEVSFILNNSLTIDKIENNNYSIQWKKIGEYIPEFRASSQKIKVTSEYPITELTLVYHGTVSSWYNILTDEIKALSFYSVWFPQEFSFNITYDEVIIENGQNLYVVKGIFDSKNNTWHYGGKGFDPFNIIVYEKTILNIVSNDYLNIYYADSEIKEYAYKATEVYNDILNFYNGTLFNRIDLPILDIVCVSPALKTGGGYQRKGLMFATDLGNDEFYLTWQLAHETAHNWCQGADIYTWEDWLNETTAEWAALLFSLHTNNNYLFNWIINMRMQDSKIFSPIKTVDGSRPNGVHSKGTLLFLEIYKKYGLEVITKMVRGFTELEIKNTENFIKMVEQTIGVEIAGEIIKGIEL